MPKIDVLLHGLPFRMDVGVIGFCSVVLIEGKQRTLVDVGHVGRRTVLQAALQQRGLTPADIGQTVMSHAHWDHSQNFDLFQGIPLLLHERERRYAKKPHHNDWATPAWTGEMIEHNSNIREVEDGYEIEPGVTVMHTPGHSPGSISVLVETDYGRCVITGDVLHFSSVALTRKNPLVFWNDDQATKSIDRIVETADLIYPGHDRPFRVVGGKIEYLEPLAVTINGMAREEPGVTFDSSPRPVWIMPGIEEQTEQSLL